MLRHAATSRKALSLYCFVLLGTSANFLLRRRLPGNVAQIRRLCEKFESTDNMNFEEIPNPLTVAGFLKKVLLVSPLAFDTRSRLKLLPTRHTIKVTCSCLWNRKEKLTFFLRTHSNYWRELSKRIQGLMIKYPASGMLFKVLTPQNQISFKALQN